LVQSLTKMKFTTQILVYKGQLIEVQRVGKYWEIKKPENLGLDVVSRLLDCSLKEAIETAKKSIDNCPP
jgi:hypothetical protein